MTFEHVCPANVSVHLGHPGTPFQKHSPLVTAHTHTHTNTHEHTHTYLHDIGSIPGHRLLRISVLPMTIATYTHTHTHTHTYTTHTHTHAHTRARAHTHTLSLSHTHTQPDDDSGSGSGGSVRGGSGQKREPSPLAARVLGRHTLNVKRDLIYIHKRPNI